MLEDLATYDNSIWQKVKSWITKAIKNIKAVYESLSPNSRAGFAMADGRMLKLSQYGQRGVQHRVIEGIYKDTKGDEAIARFIQNGNVRISAASPGIEISAEKPLTTNQLNVVSRFAAKSLAERESGIKTRSKKELNPRIKQMH